MSPRTPFWTPRLHAERRPFLMERTAIVRALRDHFADLEFVAIEEVDHAQGLDPPGARLGDHLPAARAEPGGADAADAVAGREPGAGAGRGAS